MGCDTDSCAAACAISALCSLGLLKQCTSDAVPVNAVPQSISEAVVISQFYIDIFDSDRPRRRDSTCASAAQAAVCIFCACDRLKDASVGSAEEADGLLKALKFLIDRINGKLEEKLVEMTKLKHFNDFLHFSYIFIYNLADPTTSTALRLTLAELMLEACTGKVCSRQRAAIIGGKSRGALSESGSRFLHGPLGHVGTAAARKSEPDHEGNAPGQGCVRERRRGTVWHF